MNNRVGYTGMRSWIQIACMVLSLVFSGRLFGTTYLSETFWDSTLTPPTVTATNAALFAYNSSSGGGAYVLATDNASPLSGSTLRNPCGTASNTRVYCPLPAGAVALSKVGDYVRLEFDVHEISTTNWQVMFGLLNDNGTPMTGNEFGVTSKAADDGGYYVTKYSGSTTASVYRQPFSGGAVSVAGILNGRFATESDTLAHHIALVLTRVGNNRMEVAVTYDGVTNLIVDPSPSTFTFNEVLVMASQMDYRWDNVIVSGGNVATSALYQTFWDTTLCPAIATVTNADWFFSNGSSAGTGYTLIADNTTPLNGSVMRNPVGTAANSSAYGRLPGGAVTLDKVGDYVQLEFDTRGVGTSGKYTGFGLYNDNGTAIVGNEFGVASSQLTDDGGYYFSKYTGAISGVMCRRPLGGGSVVSLGTLGGSFTTETDSAPHHMQLCLKRLTGSQMEVDVTYDGVTESIVDSSPATFSFNEIYFQASQMDYRWDNVSVVKGCEMPLTNWCEWGPAWGRAGLGVIHYNCEGLMSPQAGDLDINSAHCGRGLIEWRDIVGDADGYVDFLDATLFPRVTESYTDSTWSGMVEYLHAYLKASDSTTASAVLVMESTPHPVDAWLNGVTVSNGQTIILQPGWNRLMIKSRSPSTNVGESWTTGWSFRAVLRNPSNEIQVRTTDPLRKVLVTDTGKPFSYLSAVTRPDGDMSVFNLDSGLSTMTVSLNYSLVVSTGTFSSYQTPTIRATSGFYGYPWVYSVDPSCLPGSNSAWQVVSSTAWASYVPSQVSLYITDDKGQVILNQVSSLSYTASSSTMMTASQQITLPSLPLGNYMIVSSLLDSSGNVLARDYKHSFAVLPAIDMGTRPNTRLLGAVGHWLVNSTSTTGEAARMRWLQRVGMVRQQKLSGGLSTYNLTFSTSGAVSISNAPNINAAISDAATNGGIEIIGDALEGYYSSTTGNLVPQGLGVTMPAYGTQAWSDLYYNYGYQLGTQYKGRIQKWGGTNEVNTTSLTATASTLYVAAAQQIKAGLLAADPNNIYISSSLMGGSATLLVNAGFLNVADIVDVHSHPCIVAEPSGSSISGSTSDGRGLLVASGYTGKTIYGELSSPRAHNPEGAVGHARDMVKQFAWAINWSNSGSVTVSTPIVGLSYIVPYGGPDYWGGGLDFNNPYGDPLPVVNAASIVSHLLDGRNKSTVAPTFSGSSTGVSYIRVDSSDSAYPETLVIWRTSGGSLPVTLTVSQTAVKVVDMMGRESTYTATNGQFKFTVDNLPQYIRGKF